MISQIEELSSADIANLASSDHSERNWLQVVAYQLARIKEILYEAQGYDGVLRVDNINDHP